MIGAWVLRSVCILIMLVHTSPKRHGKASHKRQAGYSSTPRPYEYKSYGQVIAFGVESQLNILNLTKLLTQTQNVQIMKELAQKYPHLIEVTAQLVLS